MLCAQVNDKTLGSAGRTGKGHLIQTWAGKMHCTELRLRSQGEVGTHETRHSCETTGEERGGAAGAELGICYHRRMKTLFEVGY